MTTASSFRIAGAACVLRRQDSRLVREDDQRVGLDYIVRPAEQLRNPATSRLSTNRAA
jgi:hypothetical protein